MPGSAQRGVLIIWRGITAIWQTATGTHGERERGGASSFPLTGTIIQMVSKYSLREKSHVSNYSPFFSRVQSRHSNEKSSVNAMKM